MAGEADLSAALVAAQGGDAQGFEVLWQALQPALLRYLRVVAGDAAEDVASETWLQVVRDLGGFRGDAAAFRVWLFRIARNRGLDHHRRAGRRREDPDDGVLRERVGGGAAVEDEALDGLATEWALRLVASLPRQQAEAVMLRVVAGLDVAQSARVLGRRPGAVRVATMRGLRRLAQNAEVLARQGARGAATQPGGRRWSVQPTGSAGVVTR